MLTKCAGQEMLNFREFDVLTFDCYGTLIDWETGIFSALKPILAGHGKSVSDARLLEMYGEFEAQAEAREYRSYREVLQEVVSSFGKKLAFTPTLDELSSLADSVQHWQPWPDTVAALNQLKSHYRLAIISNTDDALFQMTRRHLQVNFASVVTAEQAHCYKPGLEIFNLALERVGASRNRILHVGQSIYHDVLPAQSLGLATVWVNRSSARAGVGAVKCAEGKPDLEVKTLEELAHLAMG
jgi:2-haloacid dehalogenase